MLLEVVTALISIWLICWFIKTYQERKGMPPGPTPLPIIGNLWQMRFGSLDSFEKLRQRYGEIYTISLVIGTVIVVNSGELAREALTDKRDDIAGRISETLYPLDIILQGQDISLENLSPKHSFRRKVFKSATHIYGNFGVEQADKRSYEAAQNLVIEIEKINCRPFSAQKYVRSAIISNYWQWISSKKYPLDHPTITSLDEFITKYGTLASYGSVFKIIPMSQYLPTKFNTYLKEVQNIREDIFEKELRSHRTSYSSGVTRDLTDGFLSAYEKEMEKQSAKDIGSVDDIKGLMLDVMIGGVDTSSAYVTWFILYMVLNQDVQEKIHDELDKVVGRSRYPRWKDAEDLHYLQATILEVMRHSSAASVFQRNAFRDTTLGGYRIPKGTPVLFNLNRFNNDPKQWQEPERFSPGHFLDADGKFIGWTTVPDFFPFGLGHRRCAGELLAKISLFTFFSALAHHFKFEIAEDEARPTLERVECGMQWPRNFKVSAIKRM